ncbi:hypothetical protein HY771_01145 [Candidatus Uhrbacteria bacterium]|nr:hypothetical protein [Candidatus Uhrbacteria bacterium]
MLPRFLPNLKNSKSNFKIVGFVIGAILVTAVLLRLAQWLWPTSNPTLLLKEETMIEIADPNEIAKYVDRPISFPTKTFGSELQMIGIYTEGTAIFSKNTIAVVYVKNGFRFIEIDYQPKKTLETERFFYGSLPTQEISLTDSTKGLLVNVRDKNYCKKPNDEVIGVCQITKMLMFENSDSLVVISVDGNHASDGELIEIARSMSVDEELL